MRDTEWGRIKMDIKYVDIPERLTTGKFVQLYIREVPIIAGDHVDNDHSQILEDTLSAYNISYEMIEGRRKRKIVSTSGENYTVVGMGVFVERPDGVYSLQGESLDYKLKPDLEHLKELKKYSDIEFVIHVTYTIVN